MKRFSIISLLICALALLSACQNSEINSVPTVEQNVKAPVRTIPVDPLGYIKEQTLTTQVSPVGNLLGNPGFEFGSLDSWTACETGGIKLSSDAYESSGALEVVKGNCFYQSVGINPDTELTLSCYAKLLSGNGWTGMGLGFADSDWNTIGDGASTVITGNNYQRYDVNATAPKNTKYVSMWFYSDNPALVDSCSLYPEVEPPPPPPPASDNLLDNPFFTGLDNWAVGCSGNAGETGSGLLMGGGACVDQSLSASDISELQGKEYTYSCVVKNTSDYASMSIFLDGQPTSVVIPNSSSFQTVEVKGTAGSSISSGFVSIYAEGSALLVSSCSLIVEGDEPPSGGDELLDNGDFSKTANTEHWDIGCGGEVNPRTNLDGIWLTQGCLDQTLSESDIAALRGKNYTYSCTGAKGVFNNYSSITIFLNGTPKTIVLPDSSSFDTWEITGTAPNDLNSGFVSAYTNERLSLANCSLTVEGGGGTQPGTQQWSKRFGAQDTQNYNQEYVDAVALSSTGVFTVGRVIKDLGSPNTFSLSIRKYSRDGDIIFSNVEDLSGTLLDAATDSAGNLYVVRSTTQNITPAPYRQLDLWLHKYSPNGTKLFEKIIATDDFYGGNSSGSLYYDEMLITSNNIYVSRKGSVRKFNLSGIELWNAGVSGYGVGGLTATTDGSVYVTVSGFRNYDTTLTKLNSDGTQAWKKTINTTTVGTPPTTYLAADNTHVYVMGGTVDTFTNDSGDRIDGYLWKYDSAGNEIWTSQIATNIEDRLTSAALHGGALYTTGVTGTQGFIKKINLDTAAEEWSIGLDVDGYDIFNDIAVDGTGIYAGGYVAGTVTNGNSNPISNSSDAYIVKYSLP